MFLVISDLQSVQRIVLVAEIPIRLEVQLHDSHVSSPYAAQCDDRQCNGSATRWRQELSSADYNRAPRQGTAHSLVADHGTTALPQHSGVDSTWFRDVPLRKWHP